MGLLRWCSCSCWFWVEENDRDSSSELELESESESEKLKVMMVLGGRGEFKGGRRRSCVSAQFMISNYVCFVLHLYFKIINY